MSDLAEFLNFKWKSNVHGRISYIIKLPKIKRYYDLDRGAWQATVHGITRVGHDFVLFLTSYDTMIVSTALF